jgi:hypothetical protein
MSADSLISISDPTARQSAVFMWWLTGLADGWRSVFGRLKPFLCVHPEVTLTQQRRRFRRRSPELHAPRRHCPFGRRRRLTRRHPIGQSRTSFPLPPRSPRPSSGSQPPTPAATSAAASAPASGRPASGAPASPPRRCAISSTPTRNGATSTLPSSACRRSGPSSGISSRRYRLARRTRISIVCG